MIPLSDYPAQAEPCAHPIVPTRRQRAYMPVKRAMDIVISAAALIVLIVPFCFIALALKIDAPHQSVLFVQSRVGRGGRLFSIFKFRTMKGSAPRYRASAALPNAESYMTPLGRFLRGTSIDELPQLWNILRGDMSLIGPRPLIPQEKEIHYLRAYYGIDALRPGLLGWAQINGRDRLGICEKVYYDREYLRCFGAAADLRILAASVKGAAWKIRE